MEADLETAVEFLLAAHDDDSQRGTGRTRALINRILTHYVMGSMGSSAGVLVHEESFIDGFVDLFLAQAKAMRVNASRISHDKIGLGLLTTVHLSTHMNLHLQRVDRGDLFEDHFRFSVRLHRLFQDRDSHTQASRAQPLAQTREEHYNWDVKPE